MIKLGALGAAMAGLGGRSARPAAAAAPGTNGIHIHATLVVISDGPGPPPDSTTRAEPGPQLPPVFHFNINIEVWGPDADLSGSGWGAMADPDDQTQPARVDATQRIFTQRGSVDGDVVRLKGRMLVSYVPGDVGGPIVTQANLATGQIRFYASNSASTGFLEGTGVVMRI